MKIQCIRIQIAGRPLAKKETASKKQALMWPGGRVGWWEMKLMMDKGFPGGSVIKNLPANVRDTGSIPGSGRSPGEGNGNPVQYPCRGSPVDRGAWQVHGVTKSQTQLRMHTQGQPPRGTGLHTRDPPQGEITEQRGVRVLDDYWRICMLQMIVSIARFCNMFVYLHIPLRGWRVGQLTFARLWGHINR